MKTRRGPVINTHSWHLEQHQVTQKFGTNYLSRSKDNSMVSPHLQYLESGSHIGKNGG